jgi:predicted phage terminase large subunit-like protein
VAIGTPKYGCQTEQEWANVQRVIAMLDLRHECRTNLVTLAHLLGHKDVCPIVHAQVIANVQQFKGGTEGCDVSAAKKGQFIPLHYRPLVPLWELRDPSGEDALTLDPRGHLKTTLLSEDHTIQWIINYPEIAIALMSATGDLVGGLLKNILKVFRANENFRHLFPEFCPQGKSIKDFGNSESFTVQNRTEHRKEATVSIMTVGKPMTGHHFDVIKADDVVYPENVRTKDAIQDTNRAMRELTPLLTTAKDESGKVGWIDVVGTRYDYSDYYGTIIALEKERRAQREEIMADAKLTPAEREYKLSFVKSLFRISMRTAITTNAKGEEVALWPAGMPLKKLYEIKAKMGSQQFNAQYMMNPLNEGQGLATEDQIKFVPRAELDNHILPRANQYVTVDLGGLSENARKNIGDSDYTVINHHAWTGGKLYVNKLIRGRFTPFEIIEHIFHLLKAYPKTRSVKVEEEAHARVLLPYLKKAMAEREVYIPILGIKRDNQTSKENRIRGLQPFFEADMIRFASDLPKVTKLALIDEVQYFPKYAHDDILDTCADATQERDGKVSYDMVPQQYEIHKPGFIKNPDGTITWFAAPLETPDLYHEHESQYAVDEMTGW